MPISARHNDAAVLCALPGLLIDWAKVFFNLGPGFMALAESGYLNVI